MTASRKTVSACRQASPAVLRSPKGRERTSSSSSSSRTDLSHLHLPVDASDLLGEAEKFRAFFAAPRRR
jgi:hypothetical protein